MLDAAHLRHNVSIAARQEVQQRLDETGRLDGENDVRKRTNGGTARLCVALLHSALRNLTRATGREGCGDHVDPGRKPAAALRTTLTSDSVPRQQLHRHIKLRLPAATQILDGRLRRAIGRALVYSMSSLTRTS